MNGRFISYLRVSTQKQGASGLGMEAQRADVSRYLNGGAWELLGEFVEVESGKATANRPQLIKALDQCKLTGATLVVAKLDRLSRNATFLLGLRDAGVDFVAVDMPYANRLTVGIMALVAEQEREAISRRTKDALAAAKARGTKLGGHRAASPVPDAKLAAAAVQAGADAFAERVGPTVRELQAGGLSNRGVAAALASRGVLTARGGRWTSQAVANVLGRGVAA